MVCVVSQFRKLRIELTMGFFEALKHECNVSMASYFVVLIFVDLWKRCDRETAPLCSERFGSANMLNIQNH